jgi:hypothetical protein
MKRLIALLALLPLLAMGGGQTIMTGNHRHVFAAGGENAQYISGSYAENAVNSETAPTIVPVTITCTGGEFVALTVFSGQAGTTLTFSATNGNTIVADAKNFSPVAGFGHIAHCAAGATAISAHTDATYGNVYLLVSRYTGLLYQTFDAAGSFTTATSTAFSCSATAASSGELLIMNGYQNSYYWSNTVAGYSFASPNNNTVQYAQAYNLSSVSGSNTFSTTVGNGIWYCWLAAYK